MPKLSKLVFAKTYDFGIMIKNKLNHVIEDYYVAKDDIFCVADGITRERIDGKELAYPQTVEEAIDINNNYPNPSGAYKAAKVFSDAFICEMEKQELYNRNIIMNCVEIANREVERINAGRKIDYGIEDYYACVAAGGVIKNGVLYCFTIGDCKIKIIDDEYNVLFDTTIKDINTLDQKIKKPFKYSKIDNDNWNWSNIEYRKYYRKKYRNNAIRKLFNKSAFGALTGEKSALKFVNIFIVPISDKAHYILAYSDGCDSFMQDSLSLESVINNPDIMEEEKHEKTLLIYKK